MCGSDSVGDAVARALLRDFEAIAGRKAGADDLVSGDVARIEHDYIADELLFRDAVAGGLHLTDGMVRGRLVEVMRLRAPGELPGPTAEELVNHYSEHLDRYRSEPAASFEQVYCNTLPAEPAATLASLRAAPVGRWTGPIRSSQGWRYVLVTEHLPPVLLPFDEVRVERNSSTGAWR